jgi:serine protease Do
VTHKKKSKDSFTAAALALLFFLGAVVCAPAQVAIAAGEAGEADTLKAAQTELTEIVRKVEPSVVGIVGKLSRVSKSYYDASDNIILGSGIVYRQNGYIITNQHVVEECEKLFVILSNKRVYEAKVVGLDAASDLALIKIDKGLLTPVTFADSARVEVGASVITIGTPVEFDLQNSVGLGIISGINRGNTGFSEYQFLQTDAVANPGNSGGPLMDMDGRVLGIIEGGYTSFQGITFCIPSQTILYVIPQLLRFGRVLRPDLGATLVQGLMADYGLPSGQGLFFTDILEGGPCAEAGIDEDDVLLSLNGVDLNTYTAYSEELKKYLPGDSAELEVLRGGVRRTVSVLFDERP